MDYTYSTTAAADTATIATAMAAMMIPMVVGGLIGYVLTVIGLWKMFEKAGVEGWKSIIPIYNVIVLLQISKQNPLLILLALIPGVGLLVLQILLAINIAKAYGKSGGYAVGLFFLSTIFYLILGFGDAKYVK